MLEKTLSFINSLKTKYSLSATNFNLLCAFAEVLIFVLNLFDFGKKTGSNSKPKYDKVILFGDSKVPYDSIKKEYKDRLNGFIDNFKDNKYFASFGDIKNFAKDGIFYIEFKSNVRHSYIENAIENAKTANVPFVYIPYEASGKKDSEGNDIKKKYTKCIWTKNEHDAKEVYDALASAYLEWAENRTKSETTPKADVSLDDIE